MKRSPISSGKLVLRRPAARPKLLRHYTGRADAAAATASATTEWAALLDATSGDQHTVPARGGHSQVQRMHGIHTLRYPLLRTLLRTLP